MTRLKEDWISSMKKEMCHTEKALVNRTGMNYRQLAARAAGMTNLEFDEKVENLKVGIVTFTTGLGEIGSFAESVRGIIEQMGIEAFASEKTDVAGILEAHEKGGDIVFMADDDRFIALNLKKNSVGENNIGTAKGFVVALEGAMSLDRQTMYAEDKDSNRKCDIEVSKKSPLLNTEILIIGCGTVGKLMMKEVENRGGVPVCWDSNPEIMNSLKQENFKTIQSTSDIKNYRYILDASSSGNWMGTGLLHPDSLYVSPGVPLSLNEEAQRAKENQMVHDLLQIGTAAMLALAL